MIIIKELSEEFNKQFTCLGESDEKYITFTVPIGEEIIFKNISYKTQFIDSA